MKLQEKAQEIGAQILRSFEEGKVPAALAQVFIARRDTHCGQWSWTNRLIVYLNGYTDAKTYKGWQEEGRQVRKGERAFFILEPMSRKMVNDEGEEFVRIFGFKAGARFGYEQTDGENDEEEKAEEQNFLDSLPFIEVARRAGISVTTYNGSNAGALGFYGNGNIGVGVRNLSTWAHELVHWADDALGNLVEHGQHWRSEATAELGGCILLHMIGEHEAADDGGAWEYVQRYAQANGIDPLDACVQTINRACDAVTYIMGEAMPDTILERERNETPNNHNERSA